jgi:hypothetical protein
VWSADVEFVAVECAVTSASEVEADVDRVMPLMVLSTSGTARGSTPAADGVDIAAQATYPGVSDISTSAHLALLRQPRFCCRVALCDSPLPDSPPRTLAVSSAFSCVLQVSFSFRCSSVCAVWVTSSVSVAACCSIACCAFDMPSTVADEADATDAVVRRAIGMGSAGYRCVRSRCVCALSSSSLCRSPGSSPVRSVVDVASRVSRPVARCVVQSLWLGSSRSSRSSYFVT